MSRTTGDGIAEPRGRWSESAPKPAQDAVDRAISNCLGRAVMQ